MSTDPGYVRNFWRNLQYKAFPLDWDTAELADRLGVAPNTLWRMKNGEMRWLDPELLATACALFTCTPNDLLLPIDD